MINLPVTVSSILIVIFLAEPGEAPNNSPSILAMLETLQNAPHLEVHKDMIRWILKVNIFYITTENHGNKIFETFLITLGWFPYFPCGLLYLWIRCFTLLDFNTAHCVVRIIAYTVIFSCSKQMKVVFFFFSYRLLILLKS